MLKEVRPNPLRQLLFASMTIAAILLGYGVIYLFSNADKEPAEQNQPEEKAAAPNPWYKDQKPPPQIISAPDAPLFPEIKNGEVETSRAYEEALPQEIYEPRPDLPTIKMTVITPNIVEPVEVLEVTPPWLKHAVKTDLVEGKPLIAIVIDDMGVDKRRTALATDLHGPLTLSFLTYAGQLSEQTRRASDAGHELMLHVSMEPGSKNVDPGPNVLLTEMSSEDIREKLNWGLARFPAFVGINNHMGSKFTSDARAMKTVLEVLKEKGFLFLDSRTSQKTLAGKTAREMGVPYAVRNIFLDHVNDVEAVNGQLAKVESLARRKGYAIAIGHPRDATIEALGSWLDSIEEKGFQLVPISAIVKLLQEQKP